MSYKRNSFIMAGWLFLKIHTVLSQLLSTD